MGGPEIGFTPGRTDAPQPNVSPSKDKRFTPDDRLPDAAQGADHLRHVFNRMGFDDREIVALSGAHAVGRCHTDRSGFWGPWKYGENAFSNEVHWPTHALHMTLVHSLMPHTHPIFLPLPVQYYTFLLEKTWTPKKTHDRSSAHCPVAGAWKGPLQYEADGGALMMLPTDLALVQDVQFKKYVCSPFNIFTNPSALVSDARFARLHASRDVCCAVRWRCIPRMRSFSSVTLPKHTKSFWSSVATGCQPVAIERSALARIALTAAPAVPAGHHQATSAIIEDSRYPTACRCLSRDNRGARCMRPAEVPTVVLAPRSRSSSCPFIHPHWSNNGNDRGSRFMSDQIASCNGQV
eukprot:scaffold245966_cov38-Tisochrysis_lutea.AAC.1